MTTARGVHHSYREYLELLELSSVKLEYCDGEIYAMAGGTPTWAPPRPDCSATPCSGAAGCRHRI